ncbi:MAG: CocE/NonD family hydrolase [Crocinitomicaceae bacterium]|nr:CocE/NonD family hydrolase [Crocinitomicaceae bacterium]
MKGLLSLLGVLALTNLFAALTPTYNDILIPMSDSKNLSADVYIPTGTVTGEVILIQTPYNKNAFEVSLPFKIWNNTLLDAQPFIFVVVDWRGFYGSAAAAVAQPDRGQDAYDICDWIVAQSWHGDRIGTWGPSALGGIQYQLIEKHHPNHTCAVPQVNTGMQDYKRYFYGGVLEQAKLEQLDALGYGLSTTVYANVYDSPYWDYAKLLTWYADDIQIPTLQQGGWYDHTIDAMMDFYKDSRNYANASVQDEQWLLVGPWVHGGSGAAYIGSNVQGELTYPTAEAKSDTMAWDFFEYYLLDSANGWTSTPKITYFDMGGTDDWLTSNADDIASTSTDVLYLDQNNRLISSFGSYSSSFVSVPSDPSPTIGGATLHSTLDQGPYDQNSLDSRSDIITFETDDLTQDVTITGRIQLDLWISADQADCDVAVRLTDKYPTGESMLITDGIKRLRFRNNDYTQSGEVFMTPGNIYNVQVDLPFTRYTWKAGHQIKIYISGNNAIRFNVNLQDGGTMYQTGTGNSANITVHHDASYPSKIILPGNNSFLQIADQGPSFNIYPNPANNELNITGITDIESYKLVDLSGKLVEQGQLNQSILSIDHLEAGVYIISLKDKSGNWHQQKFTKL